MSEFLVMQRPMVDYFLKSNSTPVSLKLAIVAARNGGRFEGSIDELRRELGPYRGVAEWRADALHRGISQAILEGFLTQDSRLDRFLIRRRMIALVEVDDDNGEVLA